MCSRKSALHSVLTESWHLILAQESKASAWDLTLPLFACFSVSYYDKKTFTFPLYLRPFGESNQRSFVTFKRFPFLVFLESILFLRQVLPSLFTLFFPVILSYARRRQPPVGNTCVSFCLPLYYCLGSISTLVSHPFLSPCPTWSAHWRNSVFSSLLCLL